MILRCSITLNPTTIRDIKALSIEQFVRSATRRTQIVKSSQSKYLPRTEGIFSGKVHIDFYRFGSITI